MSKKILVDLLANETGLTKADITKVVDALPVVIKSQLDADGRAVLHNIAILKRTHMPARTGRNPQSGLAMDIAAKDVVKIKPAGVMKTIA